jgi:hypothetical protein
MVLYAINSLMLRGDPPKSPLRRGTLNLVLFLRVLGEIVQVV